MIIEYFIDKDEYKKHLKGIDFTASNGVHIAKRSWKQKGKENYLLRLTSPVEKRKGAKVQGRGFRVGFPRSSFAYACAKAC